MITADQIAPFPNMCSMGLVTWSKKAPMRKNIGIGKRAIQVSTAWLKVASVAAKEKRVAMVASTVRTWRDAPTSMALNNANLPMLWATAGPAELFHRHNFFGGENGANTNAPTQEIEVTVGSTWQSALGHEYGGVVTRFTLKSAVAGPTKNDP